MKTKNLKQLYRFSINRKSGKLLAAYTALFLITFAAFYIPSTVDATHCGKSKNTVTGGNNEAGDKWGNWGVY